MSNILEKIYGQTKVASAGADDNIDLDNLSAAELLQLLAEDEGLDKVAQDQNEVFYNYGQLMAQGFQDQMGKFASTDELDLDQLSASDLLALVESGEYELAEKTAGMGTGAVLGRIREGIIGAGKGLRSAATAKNLREGVSGAFRNRNAKDTFLRNAYAGRAAKGLVQTGALAGAVGGGGYALKKKMDNR